GLARIDAMLHAGVFVRDILQLAHDFFACVDARPARGHQLLTLRHAHSITPEACGAAPRSPAARMPSTKRMASSHPPPASRARPGPRARHGLRAVRGDRSLQSERKG